MVGSVPGDIVDRYSPGCKPMGDVNHWSLFRKKPTTSLHDVFFSSNNPQQGFNNFAGGFHRRNLSVDSPIGHNAFVNGDQNLFTDRTEPFLPLGLRQVALPKGPNGQFGLYRPDCQFLKPVGRRTFSELDVRRAVLDAPTTRGPYVGEGAKFSVSLENGLEFLTRNSSTSPDTNDTQSETEEMVSYQWAASSSNWLIYQ